MDFRGPILLIHSYTPWYGIEYMSVSISYPSGSAIRDGTCCRSHINIKFMLEKVLRIKF